ncbi:MAG: DUF4430 domain-containing protein [Oscillospiraceae bacterium]|nr:DUF4430 domain-containing protein [Oscillospiraceae bacterium]
MKRVFALCLVLILCGCQSVSNRDATCRIVVSAQTDALTAECLELVPEDGVLLDETVDFETGESLLSVMLRVMRKEKIPLVYEGSFIKSIGGLAPGDAGPMSGWMFSINGELPMEGCDEILLSEGDLVEWTYVTEWTE